MVSNSSSTEQSKQYVIFNSWNRLVLFFALSLKFALFWFIIGYFYLTF